MAHIIVGVDTGKTVAIACLSLEGKTLLTAHMKNGGIQWLINEIREAGTPSVIASDKRDKGDTIRRVNSAFNAILFMPKSDISVTEKKSAARTAIIKDQHERDAYVAAVKAYNYYANKLKQAERIASSKKSGDVDAILDKVIKKHSISEALSNKKANRQVSKSVWG